MLVEGTLCRGYFDDGTSSISHSSDCQGWPCVLLLNFVKATHTVRVHMNVKLDSIVTLVCQLHSAHWWVEH